MPKKTDLELFEDLPKTRHAGSSPYARYKAAKGGVQRAKIGWLTFELPDEVFVRLSRFSNRDDWRQKIIEAIDEMCRI